MKMFRAAPVTEQLSAVAAFVESELECVSTPLRVLAQINVAVDEVFSNIVGHSGATETVIECEAREGFVTLCFIDDGIPYDPTEQPEPDITLCAEQRQIGGLGIYVLKKTMDEINYEYSGGRNRLTIIKTW